VSLYSPGGVHEKTPNRVNPADVGTVTAWKTKQHMIVRTLTHTSSEHEMSVMLVALSGPAYGHVRGGNGVWFNASQVHNQGL
jgi:hypothetical protein